MAFPNQETPLYRAWREPKDEITTGALDVKSAAEIWARRHGLSVADQDWPVEIIVRDPAGKIWSVRVDRKLVPEFAGGKPRRL